MLNQKGIVLSPILIWTIIVIVSILIAKDVIKQGYITIDLSRNAETTDIPTSIPSFIPKQTETPSPQPTEIPTLTPTQRPIVQPVVIPTTPSLPTLSGSDIFNSVNAYRSSKGLVTWSVSDELCRIAEQRADYMMQDHLAAFKSSTVGGHTGFRDLSYSGQEIGENLAANVSSTSNTMSTWEASPPHNALLLSTTLDGTPITKGCIATRVKDYGSIVVLEVGDK